ncbi:MAG: hypothetical protein M1829_004795 [Trizodia sp. TS-e1964]|nr:MAG: hypothetical protein M1829_004795 [Trizodia sp. TS-e1964]
MPTKRRASTLVPLGGSKRPVRPGSSPPMGEVKEIIDKRERLSQAIQWLVENPKEQSVTAARIFKVALKALWAALLRKKKGTNSGEWGGHNRVLTNAESYAVHRFIGDLLDHQILPTWQTIYSAVCALKRDEGREAPSTSWLTKWWKNAELHRIKTKPIAAVRYTAQDSTQISEWFEDFNRIVNELDIDRAKLWNFDEARFQVGCSKSQDILVPEDIQEFKLFLLKTASPLQSLRLYVQTDGIQYRRL